MQVHPVLLKTIRFFTFQSKKMNHQELLGNWNEKKGKLKKMFADLTDNDLLLVEGKQDELMGRLQKKLGKTESQLKEILSKLDAHAPALK
jgi:uncharacterized protein YjbJ (UPF0337 family)